MSVSANVVNQQQPLGESALEVNTSGDLLPRSPATAATFMRQSPPSLFSHSRTRDEAMPSRAASVGRPAEKVAAATEKSNATGELFRAGGSVKKEFVRFTRPGKRGAPLRPFTSDVSVGKFGVLGTFEASELERKLFLAFVHDELSLDGKSEMMRGDFLRTLFLFLAINSGSIGNMAGRMGVRDDSQPLQFGDVEISAAEVAAVLGDRAYAYMRVRASEIRDTVESAILTSRLPNAETEFPGVCRAVDLIKTVAAMKGLSQCPQYVAVGSHYAADTPPYMVALLQESAAKVLNATQGNVRESSGPGFGSKE